MISKTMPAALTSDPSPVILVVTVSFDPVDPAAITFSFSGNEGAVDWLFGLNLITEAMANPDSMQGHGDVRCRFPRDSQVMILDLVSPDGRATLEFPAKVVKDLVVEIGGMMPPEEEQYADVIDEVIEAILQE